MEKEKKEQGEQASMFTKAELHDIPSDTMPEAKPEPDLSAVVPEEATPVIKDDELKGHITGEPNPKLRPPGAEKPHIFVGRTNTCPVCGGDIRVDPDGVIRCKDCWWWQGLSE